MLYQPPFDSEDDPRWKLLAATRDRLEAAESQDDIIAIARSSARYIISADGVTFVLRVGDHCHYVEEDAIEPLWKGQKFRMTSCISGWVMMNAKIAVISDVFADERIPHDVYRKTFVRSLVMAPVGLDTPIGAIGAYWRDKPVISEREVAAVQSIAIMIGEMMRRVREIAA